MAAHKLGLILRNPTDDVEFLLSKQPRPRKFQDDEEYGLYADTDLWDLACTAQLSPIFGGIGPQSQTPVQGIELCSNKIDLSRFVLNFALISVLGDVGLGLTDVENWKFFKCVEEPEFGPGAPVNFVLVEGKLLDKNTILQGLKFSSLVHFLNFQEYPPGVVVVPMRSKTAKPFHTTNLVVFAPENDSRGCEDGSFVASGDALIVDPGCRSESLEELRKIVAALQRKLIVLATHHHRDHINGLSVSQKTNADATLLARKNTMSHIHKGCNDTITKVTKDLLLIQGHTDGHMALRHNSTRSLIVGDHSVGQGSAFLDANSGASMADYFNTTYKFVELSPHAVIPVHGRVNLCPKHMLCGYLKNRTSREESILKAIEGGAATLFENVAKGFSTERFNQSLDSCAAELDKFEAESAL